MIDHRPKTSEAHTENGDLLQRTLGSAVRDPQTVTPSGKTVESIIDGVTFWDVPTQVDDRGTLVEMYDPRWMWHPAPLVYAYSVTIRPGYVKGWALHKTHEDRYMILQGQLEVVLYDVRPDSPTYGQIHTVVLSEYNRRLMNVPAFVWHADHNIGDGDALFANFPTAPYDHENPDKYRLPLDTPLIPYSFEGRTGW